MNIPAEMEAIKALEESLNALKDVNGQPRVHTPFLTVAAGALRTAREQLGYHQANLAKDAEAASEAQN